ncbi:MAG: hypothetical protein ACD_26C00135G0003 [uncultured bacterium]|nr:MAG: hypothetical protein ACD_26C00135G0003 [uncultured bacterium]
MIKDKYYLKFFNKLRKLINLDVMYFAKAGFYGIIQQIIGVVSGLIVSYLFGHFVSKTTYGEYNLVLSVISLVTFFSIPGIDKALTQSISKSRDSSFIEALNIKLKFSLLGSLALVGFGIYYLQNHSFTIAKSIFLAAVFYPSLTSFSIYSAFLTAKRKFKALAITASISSVLFLIIIAGGIFIFSTTIGITLAYLLALILPAVGNYIYSLRFMIRKKSIDTDLSPYGIFLTIISILPWISGSLGNIILGTKLGPETLAIFAVADNFLISVQKNFMVFYKPVTAKLAAQTNKQHFETIKTHLFNLVSIGFALTLFLWLITPWLISFFFPTYSEAIKYGRLLSLALLPLPLTWTLSDMVVYQKQKKIQIFVCTIPPLLKICLYFLVIPIWKIDGLVAVFLLDRYLAPLILLPSLFMHKSIKN